MPLLISNQRLKVQLQLQYFQIFLLALETPDVYKIDIYFFYNDIRLFHQLELKRDLLLFVTTGLQGSGVGNYFYQMAY